MVGLRVRTVGSPSAHARAVLTCPRPAERQPGWGPAHSLRRARRCPNQTQRVARGLVKGFRPAGFRVSLLDAAARPREWGPAAGPL